jgi:hypothetical protein
MGRGMQTVVRKPNLGTSMVFSHCLDALGFVELEPFVRINMLVWIVLQGHRCTEYQV